MTEEVIQLTDELRSVRMALSTILSRLDTLDALARKERRRSMWHRMASGLVFLVVVAVVILGYQQFREQERDELHRCETVNETRRNTRSAIVASLLELGRDSPDQDRLRQLADRLETRLVTILPLENCEAL